MLGGETIAQIMICKYYDRKTLDKEVLGAEEDKLVKEHRVREELERVARKIDYVKNSRAVKEASAKFGDRNTSRGLGIYEGGFLEGHIDHDGVREFETPLPELPAIQYGEKDFQRVLPLALDEERISVEQVAPTGGKRKSEQTEQENRKRQRWRGVGTPRREEARKFVSSPLRTPLPREEASPSAQATTRRVTPRSVGRPASYKV